MRSLFVLTVFIIFCGLFTIQNYRVFKYKINLEKNIILDLNNKNKELEKNISELKNKISPNLCDKKLETNDYAFDVKCIPSQESIRIGQISKMNQYMMVLSQNGKLHFFDFNTDNYFKTVQLDLPNMDKDLSYGSGAKGVFWDTPNSFLVFYVSKYDQCYKPTFAVYDSLNVENLKENNSVINLKPTYIQFVGGCILQKDNPDFSGIAGAFLRLSQDSFLLSIGAPEATSHEIRKLAQDNKTVFGKIWKFNKFNGSWFTKKPQLFTKGHRNPQGITKFQPNFIFATEHGPQGGDEVNMLQSGGNYGWPLASYGRSYPTDPIMKNDYFPHPQDKNQFIKPKFYFSPSIGICGITSVENPLFDRWRKTLLVASLRNMSLHVLKLDSNLSQIISDEIIPFYRRLRTVTVENNKIYVIAEDSGIFILSKK